MGRVSVFSEPIVLSLLNRGWELESVKHDNTTVPSTLTYTMFRRPILMNQNRPIPDERDQIEYPCRRPERGPDLRCEEHECHHDLLHSLMGRLTVLEQRVNALEEKNE